MERRCLPRELERALSLSGSKNRPRELQPSGLRHGPQTPGPGRCPPWSTRWLGLMSDLCLFHGMAGRR